MNRFISKETREKTVDKQNGHLEERFLIACKSCSVREFVQPSLNTAFKFGFMLSTKNYSLVASIFVRMTNVCLLLGKQIVQK